ncbi:MAG: type IV-A pilus assembly ATPase PilB [Endozoicomonadaceae bacterium]|nr:type IV-A pilus assembly ATPase PilB [Endozoicomonadaceae bacterium]
MLEKHVTGLAKKLIQEGLLSEEKAIVAQRESQKKRCSLAAYLATKKMVPQHIICRLNAELFGLPFFDVRAMDLSFLPKDILDEKHVRQHLCLPLMQRGKRLFLAITDPNNQAAQDMMRFRTNLQIETVLVDEQQLRLVIDKVFNSPEGQLGDLDEEELEKLSVEQEADDGSEEEDGSDDAPVVKFVHKMLLSAIKMGASDLHFEPYEKIYRIRFRIDGVLREVAHPPVALNRKIVSRLKVMASMDISERRVPQDGRIKLKLSKTKAIDFRVNTLPTLWGEKVVMRILDSSSANLGIDKLGYDEQQQTLFTEALSQPQGMILVTGPTGSGKTVSLYTGLKILNTSERNISTAEDPVEIYMEGINQVGVNVKQGLDFAKALRAFLRQDPDVIMVGEIRDLETANIAIKAAQTGHMVLSTLHTNSAAETLTRLLNMGVPAFNIATSVSLIIAQRLARRLCSACRQKQKIPEEALLQQGFKEEQINDKTTIYGADSEGCENCVNGYKGRVGIFEVVAITKPLQQMIMQEKNSLEIAQQAREEGYRGLRESGLLKVLEGLTSLEEVNRVTLE